VNATKTFHVFKVQLRFKLIVSGCFGHEHAIVHARRVIMKSGICALTLLLAACATLPAPDDVIEAAKVSIAKAEEARAGEYAPQALQNARDKLRMARAEMDLRATDDPDVTARRLAEQAKADADLALSAAEAARARIASAEVNRSIEMLVQQQQRK